MPFPPDPQSVIVLPEGATSGERIVLDGPNISISAYNALSELIGLFAPDGAGNMVIASIDASGSRAALITASAAAFLELTPEDWASHTSTPALVAADIDEGALRGRLTLVSPEVDGQERLRLFLNGERSDGAAPPELAIDGEALNADVLLNGRSLGRGIPSGGHFSDSGNSAAIAAGNASDMTCTVPLVAGRLYRVALCSQLTLGTASVDYAIELEHDGTKVGRLARINNVTSADVNAYVAGAFVDYVPAADDASAALTVANGSGSGGSVTFVGAADQLRTLTVTDMGRP